ncbi:MAG TPA: hypothetical protein VFM93_01830 [Candidatus Limnocylindria bacterium]|nr:hypothetical protein [Candidatus Limnocylindria bacterium]
MDVRDRTARPVAATPTGAGAVAMAALTVSWSGIWVGALTAVVAVVLFGFIGTAIGAHQAGSEGRVTSWSGVGPAALAYAVLAAWLAYLLGGYVAVRIAGTREAEQAALYGAITFVIATVVLLALASQAAQYLNGWYSGLAPAPAAQPAAPGQPVDPNVAKAARNSAMAAAISMLIGLMGAVVGGWMGSGEPMTLRRRVATREYRAERI